jgi:YD repeat-containing protein
MTVPATPGRRPRPKRRAAAVAALFLALAALPPQAAADLYRSNAAAIAVAPITEAQRGEHEYVLEVRRGDGLRERLLFREGELIRRERLRLDGRGRVVEEERFEGGVLREVRRYDERGRLTEVLEYDRSGILERRIALGYENGRRIAERHYDATDTRVFTDRFAYDSAGRIRRVTRERDGEVERETAYAYAEGSLFEESFRAGETVRVVRYDGQGRLAYRAERRDGELVEEQEVRYPAADVRIVTTSRPGEPGVLIERFLSGRLTDTRREIDGAVVSRTRHEYEEDRLTRVVTEGRDIAGRRVERYEYDDTGELTRRIVRMEGRTLREVIYHGDRRREEITYRGGEPFLRVTYRDDNPVSRELVSGE